MVTISLMRMGAKGKPFYRIVVKEKRQKRDGKYLEKVGSYNPMTHPSTVILNHERIQYWISVGAQPTDTVRSLIKHNPEGAEPKITQTPQQQQIAQKAEADAKLAAMPKPEIVEIPVETVETDEQGAIEMKAESEEAAKVDEAQADEAKADEAKAVDSTTETSETTETPETPEATAENTEEKKPENATEAANS
ncbi:MAG: 30S ribosomal protein S16 [Pyrinomonadaceae bacterium]|nr:30S ribosomal protein S16 [Pyrinomonadaceae bacterium]